MRVGQWFLLSFQCRFMDNNLPRPGDALLGHRFRLQWKDIDGGWHDYVARGPGRT